jgi:hypothetical protein
MERSNQNESPAPVPSHPDTILKNIFGCVLVVNGAIEKFWTGREFSESPNQLKLYRSRPNKRTLEAIERAASSYGQGKYNDCFSLLRLMGYPYNWTWRSTLDIEKKWRDANLST